MTFAEEMLSDSEAHYLKKSYANIFDGVLRLRNSKGESALANEISLKLVSKFRTEKLNCLWFHVPNESIIKKKQDFGLLILKRSTGMLPGVADFVFISNKDSKTIFVELKLPKKGVLSKSQKTFKEWCEDLKIPYYVVTSWESLEIILLDNSFLLP